MVRNPKSTTIFPVRRPTPTVSREYLTICLEPGQRLHELRNERFERESEISRRRSELWRGLRSLWRWKSRRRRKLAIRRVEPAESMTLPLAVRYYSSVHYTQYTLVSSVMYQQNLHLGFTVNTISQPLGFAVISVFQWHTLVLSVTMQCLSCLKPDVELQLWRSMTTRSMTIIPTVLQNTVHPTVQHSLSFYSPNPRVIRGHSHVLSSLFLLYLLP